MRCGIENKDNTCYRNATLQCLLHSPQFETQRLPKAGKTWRKLEKLVREMSSGSSSCEVELNLDSQGDAQEFFIQLLNALMEEELKSSSKSQQDDPRSVRRKHPKGKASSAAAPSSVPCFITSIFQGQIKHTMRCSKCSSAVGAEPVLEPFFTLSLPLPRPQGEQVRLESLLEEFSKEEILDSDMLKRCSKCKREQRVTRRSEVVELPQVLVLHLFRIPASYWDEAEEGICVGFPVEEKLVCCGASYQLYGVVNHDGGHYTATIRLGDGNWCRFDDANVTDVDPPAPSVECFMLFYQKME